MKNKMTDVRDHLIEQLERLKDVEPDQLKNEIARAQAIGEIGSVLIESAKVECQYLRSVEGAVPTGFLPDDSQPNPIPNVRKIA